MDAHSIGITCFVLCSGGYRLRRYATRAGPIRIADTCRHTSLMACHMKTPKHHIVLTILAASLLLFSASCSQKTEKAPEPQPASENSQATADNPQQDAAADMPPSATSQADNSDAESSDTAANAESIGSALANNDNKADNEIPDSVSDIPASEQAVPEEYIPVAEQEKQTDPDNTAEQDIRVAEEPVAPVPLKQGEICIQGNCPCGQGFCPKDAVCNGNTCTCGINRDDAYTAGKAKPCNKRYYPGYTCQPLEKKGEDYHSWCTDPDSVWASSSEYGEFSCEYLDVPCNYGEEHGFPKSLLWGFMCKNPLGCYHHTEHFAPVPPDFNPRSELVPGKGFDDSRFSEWPDTDYKWKDKQARVFTAVTRYDSDVKCPYHIDGDTDTTEETICETGDCVLPLKDGHCSLLDVDPHTNHGNTDTHANDRLMQFDAAACPGGTRYCHGVGNAPDPIPKEAKGYRCETIYKKGKPTNFKAWVCSNCRYRNAMCYHTNACLCGNKICMEGMVCLNDEVCIPEEEYPDEAGKSRKRPVPSATASGKKRIVDEYYYTTDPARLAYCGSESSEAIQQETKFRDDYADLFAKLKLIPNAKIENDRCLTRRMCDLQFVPPEKRSQYVCDHGLFMLKKQDGTAVAADRPLGLRCTDPDGCTCGKKTCLKGSICHTYPDTEFYKNDRTHCRYDSIFMHEVCDVPMANSKDPRSMYLLWDTYNDSATFEDRLENDCPPLRSKRRGLD